MFLPVSITSTGVYETKLQCAMATETPAHLSGLQSTSTCTTKTGNPAHPKQHDDALINEDVPQPQIQNPISRIPQGLVGLYPPLGS